MTMNQQLKELLKPPFYFNPDDNCISDSKGHRVFWMAGYFHDDMPNFILRSLNEKWERDFGEPLRWKFVGKNHEGRNMYQCPKCEQIGFLAFNFCHECGQRLLPPEENI
jgi:hypothetical protein